MVGIRDHWNATDLLGSSLPDMTFLIITWIRGISVRHGNVILQFVIPAAYLPLKFVQRRAIVILLVYAYIIHFLGDGNLWDRRGPFYPILLFLWSAFNDYVRINPLKVLGVSVALSRNIFGFGSILVSYSNVAELPRNKNIPEFVRTRTNEGLRELLTSKAGRSLNVSPTVISLWGAEHRVRCQEFGQTPGHMEVA